MKLIVALLLAPASFAFAQAIPTAPPGDNPTNTNVYMGRLPKVDKSKLRDLKGLVKDDAGNPLEGAIVQLKDLKSNKIVSFRTQADGAYLFYDLNLDQDYELKAFSDSTTEPVMKKFSHYDTRKKPFMNFDLTRKAVAKPAEKQ